MGRMETRDMVERAPLQTRPLCTISSKESTNAMWPTSEEMRNLHHIYSDMTGLVVIIT